MPVQSVGEGPCKAGAKMPHGRPVLRHAVVALYLFASFRCANAGSDHRHEAPGTPEPTRLTHTLDPTNPQEHSSNAAQFCLTFRAYGAYNNYIACQLCPVLGMRSTGCHASGLDRQICSLQAGRGGERGAFILRRRFWIAIEGIFVAAQPMRRCRLTARHRLSRTLQLQIKRKNKMINQSNRKKIINK